MPNRPPDDELLAAALAGAKDCPPLEDLERLLTGEAPASLQRHVDACAHCRTELQMLRSFTENEIPDRDRAAVEAIAARLRVTSSALASRLTVEEHPSWWRRILAVRWLTPAAAALAVALVVGGAAIELKLRRQPSLDTSTGGTEVLRSSTIAILSPMGDLQEKPHEIRWEAVANAAQYRVRILEADRVDLWTAKTTAPRIDLPSRVESLIVPAKTLLVQVGAFDAAGRKIAESEVTRFRVLQKLYTR